MKNDMKEIDIEGLANRDGPESCAESREGLGEALTGGSAGWVLSREMEEVRGANTMVGVEGNTFGRAIASARMTPRGRRPHACTESSRARTGRSTSLPRRMAASGRAGKAMAAIRR